MRAPVLALLWAAITVSLPATNAQSQTPSETGPGSAVIVLDGSGSMGGPLEGQKDVKFEMASRALLQLLPSARPQSRIGLVTFGNRRKGDCSDVSIAIPPAPDTLEQFRAIFQRIGSNGRGPLVAGVREAAKTLPADTPGTLIVIHDDVDNCKQDVCALAAELPKSNPKLAVHVISISLDKTTSERMSCLATATGGRSFEARDSASLETALNDALGLAGITGAAPQAAVTVPDAAPTESAGPPSVRLTASLSASSQPLGVPVHWRVLPASAADGTAVTPVKEATSAVLTSELPPGNYIAEAGYGLASARAPFEVASEGQTQLNVALEAASVKISTTAGKAGELLANPVISLSSLAGASDAKPVYVSQDPMADLVLPSGPYRLSVADGLAIKQQDITLTAGDSKTLDVQLATGLLELTAVNREGGDQVDGVTFILSVDDPDSPQGRREVARSLAPRPTFVLTAGTYYVTAKLGAAEVKDRLAIGTGDVVKRALPLNGTWTSLSASFEQGFSSAGSQVVFRVLSKDAEAREVARANGPVNGNGIDVFLPQGSYRIEAAIGRLNVKGQSEVDIVAGPKSAIAIKVAASELTILPSSGAAAGPAAAWNVRDSQGRVVHRSLASRQQRTILVAPGSYVVHVEAGDTRSDRPVDLKPGEKHTLALGGN